MENLREKGVWISGNKEKVLELTADYPILDQEKIMSKVKVMIDDTYSKDWEQKASKNGLYVDQVTLQDYLLNLTKQRNEVL